MITCAISIAQTTSYLSEDILNSVVLLEKKVDDTYIPHGTGFLMVSYDEEYPIIVVTNEHVLRNKSIYVTIAVDSAFIEFMNKNNSKVITFRDQSWDFSGNKIRHKFDLIPDSTFVRDKELDIAAFKLNIGSSVDITDSTTLKVSNIISIGITSTMPKENIQLGTEVFFLGFPFSIGTEYGWYYKGKFTRLFSESIPVPLVREGIVSWASPNWDLFLLDALSYNGNSGSPIFTKNSQGGPYLIGIVRGHLDSDSSDNIGLANCVWVDKILELVKKL